MFPVKGCGRRRGNYLIHTLRLLPWAGAADIQPSLVLPRPTAACCTNTCSERYRERARLKVAQAPSMRVPAPRGVASLVAVDRDGTKTRGAARGQRGFNLPQRDPTQSYALDTLRSDLRTTPADPTLARKLGPARANSC